MLTRAFKQCRTSVSSSLLSRSTQNRSSPRNPSSFLRRFCSTTTTNNNMAEAGNAEINLNEYDPMQVALMGERCILVDENDKVVGHESKKNCALFRHSRPFGSTRVGSAVVPCSFYHLNLLFLCVAFRFVMIAFRFAHTEPNRRAMVLLGGFQCDLAGSFSGFRIKMTHWLAYFMIIR